MKIEIRPCYLPNNPKLREIKILIDGKCILSELMNKKQIEILYMEIEEIKNELIYVCEELED